MELVERKLGNQFIHSYVYMLDKKYEAFMTLIYGSLRYNERNRFWETMEEIS